jgi:hypothetical protein
MWNTARGVWEIPGGGNLFCEHWEPFSAVFPPSGQMVMTPDGQVSVLPMPERLIPDSAYSLLESDEMMPTPTLGHIRNYDEDIEDYQERRSDFLEGRVKGMPGVSLGVAIRMEQQGIEKMRKSENELMPTPKALDGIKGNLKTSQERIDAGHFVDLPNIANDYAADATNWGKFEPAIRRWEEVLGRSAPSPTLPDGKDGGQRLSPWLTEWMMGLPEGWVCSPEIGLSRNEQLKACGNGVVPQQAELALEMLGVRELLGLADSPKVLERERERFVNLPTPTVSDTFTSNLKSTQQKDGSMHSVTLPQAVERLVNNES